MIACLEVMIAAVHRKELPGESTVGADELEIDTIQRHLHCHLLQSAKHSQAMGIGQGKLVGLSVDNRLCKIS